MPTSKTVKSLSDLRSQAIGEGGKIDDGKAQFNAGMVRADQSKRRLLPANQRDDVQPAPPPPPKPDPGSKLVADKLDEVSRRQARLMEDLSEQISKIHLATAGPVLEWDFDFVRDESGALSRIRATANPSMRNLN